MASFLVLAREDNWETSSAFVGVFDSLDKAQEHIKSVFENVAKCDDDSRHTFVWKNKFTKFNVKKVHNLTGLFNQTYGDKNHHIVILECE